MLLGNAKWKYLNVLRFWFFSNAGHVFRVSLTVDR